MSAEVIEEIGKYRIIGELGHGGMGMVYLAEDKNLGRQVALKVLLGNFASDELFKQRFRQEARSISSIVHPNVVQIHSMDEIDDHLIIDIEYVEGQPLSEILRTQPITPEWMAHITRDVLEGLSVCHEIGVVHRDIKPSNILMTLNGQAKIADFGIAKALADSGAMAIEDSHSTTAFLGTPRFTPPEAWDGQPANPLWDLYSLGILLYESLTRRPAFQSNTMLSLMKEINTSQLAPIETKVEGISPEFSSLINDLVKIDPAERPPSAKEALLRLKEAKEIQDGMYLDENTVTIPIPKPLTQKLRNKTQNTHVEIQSKRGSLIPILLIGLLLIGLLSVLVKSSDSYNPTPVMNTSSTVPIVVNTSPVWWASSLRENDGQGWQLLWNLNSDTARQTILAYHDYGFMYLESEQFGSRVTFIGEWAGYRTTTGVGFRSGEVKGTGVIHDGLASMTLTLEFQNERDNSGWAEVFLVEHDPERVTSIDFTKGIEISEWLPSLLQNEIYPRSIEIGRKIDALLPWSKSQRVMAPLLTADENPVIDGELNEALWSNDHFHKVFGRIGELAALQSEEQHIIHVRHDGATLYFSLVTSNDPSHEIGMDFSILQTINKPASLSVHGELTLSNQGVYERKNFRGPREISFSKPWQAASLVKNANWSAEWTVPMDEAITLDETGRIRFVAVIWRRDDVGTKHSLAYWGEEDMKRVAHGSILIPARQ